MMNTSVKEIMAELKRRDIETVRFALPEQKSLINFEYAGKQRAISGTSPDLTAATGRTIANNKTIAAAIAEKVGLPVPKTEVLSTLEKAEQFLIRHDKIVVKPLDSAHGHGVTTNVTQKKQLHEAIKRAQKESDTVLLQQQVSGIDERVLVIGGKVAAISERVPASVVGDGKHSIRQLIQTENETNPLRGVNYEKPLNIIDMEAAKLFLGKRMADIPKSGEAVQVVGTANMGTGGKAINRTGKLPAALVKQAELYADAIDAFTCGVDFMYNAEQKEWFFIEANSSPSFGLHLWPSEGDPINVTELFVDRLLEAYDSQHQKVIVGRNESVEIIGYAQDVPAKIDTGADSSAIWASNISVTPDGILHFTLFDETSPFYTGEVIDTDKFQAVSVRSGSGHVQIRYNVDLRIRLKDRIIRTFFNLSDRSTHRFPILIGRKTLHRKFLVDVDRKQYAAKDKPNTQELTQKLAEDPYKFHQTYYK